MILLWDGSEIQAVDLDKVIPGPRAEEVAALLEPGYLRGYLEGRGHDVAIREIKKRGRLGRDYRQIQKLLRKQPSSPPFGAPWQYAMFLKERILEQAEPLQLMASSPNDAQPPEVYPSMPVEEQAETSAVDEVQQPEAKQATASAVDDAQPSVVLPDVVETTEEAAAPDDGGGGKKRRKRRRKKRRKNCTTANDTC